MIRTILLLHGLLLTFLSFGYTYYNPTAYGFLNPSQQGLFVSIRNTEKNREEGKSFVFDALTKELLYTAPRFFNMNDVELCSNSDYFFCEFSESDKKYLYQKIVVYYKGQPYDSLEWKSGMKEFFNSTYSYTEEWKEDAAGIYFRFKDKKVMRYSFDKRTFDTVSDPDERAWLFCYRSENELVTDIFSAEYLNVGESTPLKEKLLADVVIPESAYVKLQLTIDWNGVKVQSIQVDGLEIGKEEQEELKKKIVDALKSYRFTEGLYLNRTGIWHYETTIWGNTKN